MDRRSQSVRQDPQAPLPASARTKQSSVRRGNDGKKVTFACCFLFSKLNLTMTVAVAVSDPCVLLARKKGDSEKEEGWRLFTFLPMITVGLCNSSRPLLKY